MMRGAAGRFFQYFRVLRWLFSFAFQTARGAIFASVLLVVLSIGLQLVAVLLSLVIIGRLAPGNAPSFANTETANELYAAGPQLAGQFSNEVTIALLAVFFVASALCLYFGRVATLHVESHVISGAERQGLACFAQMSAEETPPPEIGPASRLIALGSRSGGRVVRLVLRSVAEFGYLGVGLFILFLMSPWIFVVLAAFVGLGLALNYPISLSSYRTAKAYELASMKRRQTLRAMLQDLQKAPAPAHDVSPQTHDFLSVLRRRLTILEVARLAFGLFFVLALTGLLVLVSQGHMTELINLASLFLLIVVFRYIFSGYQGLMVLVTTTNRFLPNAVRLHMMVTQLEIPVDPSRAGALDDDDDDE